MQRTGQISKSGMWNNVLIIDGLKYRERVEVLILNSDNEVFLELTG